MSILHCIYSYIKSHFKQCDEPDHVIEYGPTQDPRDVTNLLEKLYQRLTSICSGAVIPIKDLDRLSITNGRYLISSNKFGRNHCTIEFQSDKGNTWVILGRVFNDKNKPVYDMNYIGSDGRAMFHTIDGKLETEHNYSIEQCRLAIEEFLDYINDAIPATK